MKHFLLFFLLFSSIFAIAAKKKIQMGDTSLVRISTPEYRAELIGAEIFQKVYIKDDKKLAELDAIMLRYEHQMQDLVLTLPDSPLKRAKTKSKKKIPSLFDKLEEARDKDVKKILSRKEYAEYAKKRNSIRTKVKQLVIAEKTAIDKEIAMNEELERRRIDSIAAVEAAAAAAAAEAAELEAKKAEERAARIAAKKKAAKKKKKTGSSTAKKKKKKKKPASSK
ncbi:MAG: hypothetical protein ACRC9X_08535 [Bacteroidales bacterium]